MTKHRVSHTHTHTPMNGRNVINDAINFFSRSFVGKQQQRQHII